MLHTPFRELIGKLNDGFSRFGIQGTLAMGLAKILRRPVLMTVRAKCLAHPVHLRARTSDLLVYEQVIINEQYRCETPQEPKIIIDAGANIGLASVYFANRYAKARILAVEPEPQNFRLLQQNVGCYKNIEPIRSALWSKNTQVHLKDMGKEVWGFQVAESPGGPIPALTLSELLFQTGISYVDILKVDIEGAEREVFAGSPEWTSKVGLMMIELHDSFEPGCSHIVCEAMANHSKWVRGEVTFFHLAQSRETAKRLSDSNPSAY